MTTQKNVLSEAHRRICDHQEVVLASIVEIIGSSSQPLGSRMAVFADGTFVGNVSGGCVENDIVSQSETVRGTKTPRLVEYHPVTDPVFEVGLNCDGSILVLLEPAVRELIERLRTSKPGVMETRVTGSAPGPAAVERRIVDSPNDGETGHSETQTIRASKTEVLLREPLGTPLNLLIFGASDTATVLADLASRVGFAVTVSDPRGALADPERHPGAQRVIPGWPGDVLAQTGCGAGTYVVSLNHEPKFEDALFVALMDQERPDYIGAIGKPQRQAERIARQEAGGFDLNTLPKIHTPIGIPIGGKSPEDVAVSILAELIATRNHLEKGEPYRFAALPTKYPESAI